MASCILCHALIKNLITPLHHSCIQKSRYLEGLTKPSVCFYWASLICVFRTYSSHLIINIIVTHHSRV